MKNVLIIIVVFATLWAAIGFTGRGAAFGREIKKSLPQQFELLLTEENNVITLSRTDYLIGCLYAEIPINFELEALKAQAVAANTYAVKLVSMKDNDPLLQKYNGNSGGGKPILTDDTSTSQEYFTKEQAEAYYKEDYIKYYKTIETAAKYAEDKVICYKNEPIYAVYHSVSSGGTNTPFGVWGISFPYLEPVASQKDKEYINYLCDNEFRTEEIRVALLNYDRDIEMPLEYEKWFIPEKVSNDGYVISMKVGNKVLSGGDMWRVFDLRSPNFTVRYTGSSFIFSTKGFGHGVGLSQYGANEMAKEGKTAEEILLYYYKDVSV